MNYKKIIGCIMCIGGLVLIFVSNYIKKQVEEGKITIANAEQKVNQGQSLFGLTPITKELGQRAIIDPAQKKINAGKQEVLEYTILAERLLIGGIVLFVAGLAVVVIPFGSKKTR